jgi:hypothetical protein
MPPRATDVRIGIDTIPQKLTDTFPPKLTPTRPDMIQWKATPTRRDMIQRKLTPIRVDMIQWKVTPVRVDMIPQKVTRIRAGIDLRPRKRSDSRNGIGRMRRRIRGLRVRAVVLSRLRTVAR